MATQLERLFRIGVHALMDVVAFCDEVKKTADSHREKALELLGCVKGPDAEQMELRNQK